MEFRKYSINHYCVLKIQNTQSTPAHRQIMCLADMWINNANVLMVIPCLMARACKRAHSQNTVMNMAAVKSVIRARPQPVVHRPKKIRDAKHHQMHNHQYGKYINYSAVIFSINSLWFCNSSACAGKWRYGKFSPIFGCFNIAACCSAITSFMSGAGAVFSNSK